MYHSQSTASNKTWVAHNNINTKISLHNVRAEVLRILIAFFLSSHRTHNINVYVPSLQTPLYMISLKFKLVNCSPIKYSRFFVFSPINVKIVGGYHEVVMTDFCQLICRVY